MVLKITPRKRETGLQSEEIHNILVPVMLNSLIFRPTQILWGVWEIGENQIPLKPKAVEKRDPAIWVLLWVRAHMQTFFAENMTLRAASLKKLPCHVDFPHIS